MAHLVYVDCSNLVITARRLAAIARGLARNWREVNDFRIADFSYHFDFQRFIEFISQPGRPDRAVAFGSVVSQRDGMWAQIADAGFETQAYRRNIVGKEKFVDTALVAMACRDVYRFGQAGRDRITLVAGDGDYLPLVSQLREDGFWVTVIFWGSASRLLAAEASEFVNLDGHLTTLGSWNPAPPRVSHPGQDQATIEVAAKWYADEWSRIASIKDDEEAAEAEIVLHDEASVRFGDAANHAWEKFCLDRGWAGN